MVRTVCKAISKTIDPAPSRQQSGSQGGGEIFVSHTAAPNTSLTISFSISGILRVKTE
jgi:hypothetical protein